MGAVMKDHAGHGCGVMSFIMVMRAMYLFVFYLHGQDATETAAAAVEARMQRHRRD